MNKSTEQANIPKKPLRRKYIIAAGFILCVIAGYVYWVLTWNPVDSESIKESEAIIRQLAAAQLNKDPNLLTDVDFEQITVLGLGGKELSDIKLLEKFTNLQTLNLLQINWPKKEIPFLMKVLVKIKLYNPNKKFALDLSPLEKLTNLQELYLSGLLIKDITPLSGIINLKHLVLYQIPISNYESLKDMKNLEFLQLNDISISDLDPIKKLTNLKIIYIYDCPDITNEQIEDLQKALPNLVINTKITKK
jgi:Leucine-rich repeat (LRR) protein